MTPGNVPGLKVPAATVSQWLSFLVALEPRPASCPADSERRAA